jgi:hypothetical protein
MFGLWETGKWLEDKVSPPDKVNTAGKRPKWAKYDDALDADGTMQDNMTANLDVDMRGMDAYRERALNEGPSAWAGMMTEKQGLEEATARDNAVAQSAGATASAQSNLAMRGGLSSGARERVAAQGASDLMNSQQDIGRAGEQARLGIGIEDESMRMNALSQLPGMELNLGQANMAADQWNIGNAMNERHYGQDQKLAKYQEDMRGWAANKQADATANQANKSSGWFGLF